MDHMDVGIGFAQFLNGILAIAFTAWSAALWGARKDLKEIREDFTKSMSTLANEISRLREELVVLGNRVTRVEIEQSHYDRRDRNA